MTKSNFNIPTWIKALFFVAIFGVLLSIFGVVFFENVDEVIEDQLVKIREKQITEAYYDYTSRDFQSTTSLDVFKDFISLYPVLENNLSYTLSEKDVQNNLATITGTLKSNTLEEIKTQWHLVKEDNIWKIASIKLLESDEEFGTRSYVKELEKAVTDHLLTIKDQETLDAYYNFSSVEFQEDINFDTFKEYVTKHPILTDFSNFSVTDSALENDRGFINVLLNSDRGDNWLIEYSFLREEDLWKVLSMRIILPPDVAIKDISSNPESLVPPVKKILDNLLFGQIRSAYQSTSKQYQKRYSYQDFEGFVKQNQIIIRRDYAEIQGGIIENGNGTLRVNFHDEKGKAILEFYLRMEGSEWRIAEMQIVKEKSLNTLAVPNKTQETYKVAKSVESIIQKQLNYLRNFNFSKAYQELTTTRFKRENSVDEFEDFLSQHPEFVNNFEGNFHRIALNDDVATMRGTIINNHKTTYPVRYDLVLESGDWKIDDFISLPTEDPIADVEYIFDTPQDKKIVEPMELSRIDIGTNADSEGIISKPSQILKGIVDNLIFNVYVNNAIDKALLTLTLKHVDTGSEAPSLTAYLNQDGDTTIVFSFDRPEDGWPNGEYVVRVTTSTGLKIIKTFRIENKEDSGEN